MAPEATDCAQKNQGDALTAPRPIQDSPRSDWQSVEYVLTDIDDTLSTDGRLTSEAYAMLEKLSEKGLKVIPVTGRPGGWCDMIARFWPVAAVVGENGAFYFRYDHINRKMTRVFTDDDATRAASNRRLHQLREMILRTVPGAAVAADQIYRHADLAIDFREDVSPLPEHAIAKIVEIFEHAGAVAKVSSIHVNGWYGSHTKLTMTRRLLQNEFALDLEQAEGQRACAFIGDSANDSEMFAAVRNSVGVANLSEQIQLCQALPTWITTRRSGEGFCEFARHLLAERE